MQPSGMVSPRRDLPYSCRALFLFLSGREEFGREKASSVPVTAAAEQLLHQTACSLRGLPRRTLADIWGRSGSCPEPLAPCAPSSVVSPSSKILPAWRGHRKTRVLRVCSLFGDLPLFSIISSVVFAGRFGWTNIAVPGAGFSPTPVVQKFESHTNINVYSKCFHHAYAPWPTVRSNSWRSG